MTEIDDLEAALREKWRAPLDSRQKCAARKNGKKGFAVVREHANRPESIRKRAVALSQWKRTGVPVTLAPIGKPRGQE
jgi:hypothetical protein